MKGGISPTFSLLQRQIPLAMQCLRAQKHLPKYF